VRSCEGEIFANAGKRLRHDMRNHSIGAEALDLKRFGAPMSDSAVAKQGPCSVALKVGRTYFWCACGRSQRQPFCDGSHAGTEFTPLRFTPRDDHDAVLCGCKRTRIGPFCDCTRDRLSPSP